MEYHGIGLVWQVIINLIKTLNMLLEVSVVQRAQILRSRSRSRSWVVSTPAPARARQFVHDYWRSYQFPLIYNSDSKGIDYLADKWKCVLKV